MKKVCLLVLALFLTVGGAHAYINSADMTTEEFIKNEGFSSDVYRLINLKTNTVEARKQIAEDHKKHRVRNFFKKCYSYIDPYAENDEKFGTHDIQFKHNWDEI